ncbi:alpha/beta hydrolase-fold protein [Phytohabitans flavus]|uniref:Esterase n=1 Tax=Phytohabitans flavus TaxID=1076124 RepID=A0A6F8XV39_9ACTN|nr:alpha/beta hydrolase-fold protein [Phytohabitans flavus]BCB77695.1 hypothetical protein Pflav_041050 [Phytohabitans flavus]
MDSQLTRDVLKDPLVSQEVPYAVLTPPSWSRDERLPLVLLLHGASSSAEVLNVFQPVVERLWIEGALPRSVVASASTPTAGGFYIDHGPGHQWESLVANAFPQLLATSYGVDPERVSLLGASMGGYGALKIAFADPGRWEAVAAVAPALLPAEPGARNTLGVLGELAAAMAGAPGNDALERLRANAEAVRASSLPIFLRCGDRDVFAMHDGTERLHRALWDLDIGHDYHLVYGADHIGPEGWPRSAPPCRSSAPPSGPVPATT